MRKLLILASIVFGFSQATAQEERAYDFTLEEAISFALDSNYTAINARRDIARAIKQKWETTATGLPQISANIQYQNFIKQPVSLLPAAAFDNTSSVVNTVSGRSFGGGKMPRACTAISGNSSSSRPTFVQA